MGPMWEVQEAVPSSAFLLDCLEEVILLHGRSVTKVYFLRLR